MRTIGEVFGDSPARSSEPNPFARDDQGRIISPSAITKAIRENPRRAIELCKAAGEDLDRWFPTNPR